MKRIVVMLIITMTLVFAFSASASASQQAAEIIADVVLVRPVSLAAVIVGTALFIVALPFSAPSGSVSETAQALVATPFRYTFARPIGDFGRPPYYTQDVDYGQTSGEYIIVNPPPPIGAVTQSQPQGTLQSLSDRLFIYPRRGQTEQEQVIDRNVCHQFAMGQTGYDPTLPPKGGPDAAKRADYQRAMAACLDLRGYAVK